MTIYKVLFATDVPPALEPAGTVARELARRTEARLHVIHVVRAERDPAVSAVALTDADVAAPCKCHARRSRCSSILRASRSLAPRVVRPRWAEACSPIFARPGFLRVGAHEELLRPDGWRARSSRPWSPSITTRPGARSSAELTRIEALRARSWQDKSHDD